MAKQYPVGDVWAQNALHRAVTVGQNVYLRAASRKVNWPEYKPRGHRPIEESDSYTSIDDAFSTIVQFMSHTSRQCKKYYDTNKTNRDHCDSQHCRRFHNPGYSEIQNSSPLQRTEDVHVVVQPGTYSVTAGCWGQGQQRKHVVHVDKGQSVDLDFCL
ncbi:A-kinase-interacting protein 1-like [Mytilus edulis]|uniref:A-kinase-interacting protein 1-like n=1 Tax=Mytilus edulis TaxID=6550 RepID=UPI0039F10A2D